MESKLREGVSYDATVIKKEDVYTDLGFWAGEVVIDLPESSPMQKILKDEYFKEFTRNMEVGKKYKITFEIDEL